MVQLGQLKPNNLLTDPAKDNQLVKVIRININDGNDGQVHEVDPNYVYSYEVDLRTLDPIPLSPEWLEKFEFKYLKVNGITQIDNELDAPEGDTHNWTKQIKRSNHCDHFAFEIVKWGAGPYTYAHQWLRVRIQYVHQLMNLFYALTGTELVIDQTKNG